MVQSRLCKNSGKSRNTVENDSPENDCRRPLGGVFFMSYANLLIIHLKHSTNFKENVKEYPANRAILNWHRNNSHSSECLSFYCKKSKKLVEAFVNEDGDNSC